MSLEVNRSLGVTSAQDVKTTAPAKKQEEQKEVSKSNLGNDSVKTGGLKKDPSMVGVHSAVKDALSVGTIVGGAAAGAGALALLGGGMTLIGTGKFNPLVLGVKPLLVGAGIGAVVGVATSLQTGILMNAARGEMIKKSVENAQKSGKDELGTVQKNAKMAGAALGAAGGLWQAKDIIKSGANPLVKVGVTAAAVGLGAWAGASLASKAQTQIYNMSK